MKFTPIVAAAVAAFTFAGTTFGAVMIDGTVGPMEYTTSVADIDVPAEAVDYAGTGLDIASINFEFDDVKMSIGVDTVGTFDFDGNSFPGIADRTLFSIIFYDGLTPLVELSVVTFSPTDYAVLMTDPMGFIPMNITMAPGVFVSFDDDLELVVPYDLLPDTNANVLGFSAQLDSQDEARDDVLIGDNINIPEPASLALVAIGGVMMLRRRK